MIVVRFYWTDPDDHIHFAPEEVECQDDADAVAKAMARLVLGRDGWSIEVWDRARRIAKLKAGALPADATAAQDQDRAARPGTSGEAAGWNPFVAHSLERLGAK